MNLLPLSKEEEDIEAEIQHIIPKSRQKLAEIKEKTKHQQPVG